jgi:DNA-binding response OmpR family regulator
MGEQTATMSACTVLLVEGRKSSKNSLLRLIDGRSEYEVVVAKTCREALSKVHEVHPAVIILDLPSLTFSPHNFCASLKGKDIETPILLLLPPGEKVDHSLETQAYIRYPFSAGKLISHILKLLPASGPGVLQVGDIILNIEQRCVIRGDRETHLTPRQVSLLELFMRHPGEILTRAYLMKRVWNTDYIGDTRTLDVHIHWLRKAIEEDHRTPVYLRTIRRIGYRFEVPETTQCEDLKTNSSQESGGSQ